MKLVNTLRTISIVGITLFYSCSSAPKIPSLNIVIHNNEDTAAYLYGYAGDKQILIEEIIIKGDSLAYDLEAKANTGVYRFVCGEASFDFLYSGSPLGLEYDSRDVNSSLKETSDRINHLFLNFQKDAEQLYVDFSDDSIVTPAYCEAYHTMFNKYMNNPVIQNTALYNIINFLYIQDYQCYKIKSSNTLSHLDYMLHKYPDFLQLDKQELLVTPFLYPILSNYLDFFQGQPDSVFSIAVSQLLIKSSNSDGMQYLVSALAEAKCHAQGRIKVLESEMDGNCNRVLGEGYFKHEFINAGQSVGEIFTALATKEKNTLLVFYSDKDCPLSSSIMDSIAQYSGGKHNRDLQMLSLNIDSLQVEDIDKLNIYALPTALLISQDGILLSRWSGTKKINAFIQKK